MVCKWSPHKLPHTDIFVGPVLAAAVVAEMLESGSNLVSFLISCLLIFFLYFDVPQSNGVITISFAIIVFFLPSFLLYPSTHALLSYFHLYNLPFTLPFLLTHSWLILDFSHLPLFYNILGNIHD